MSVVKVGVLLVTAATAACKSAPQDAESPTTSEPAPEGRSSSIFVSDLQPTGTAAAFEPSRSPVESASAPTNAALGNTRPSSAALEKETGPSPVLVDANGNVLPQTNDRPTLDSASFRERLELLVTAIAENRPELALPAFFPQLAYAQVKAIKDPNRDWERRLVKAFTRNIGEYHQQLGPNAGLAKFLRLEIPEAKVKWIEPGIEGNRLGYYRVTRSKLVVSNGDNGEVSLELTSLISWRGEWYVVHLHGFE